MQPADFNTYGSRRGNDDVMVRGTFANIRIKNLMLGGEEGGNTIHYRRRTARSCRSTTRRCSTRPTGVPLVVFAGKEYGTGSSRDWAAKGTMPAGREGGRSPRASSASTAPTWSAWACCRCSSWTARTRASLGLKGDETFDITGLR